MPSLLTRRIVAYIAERKATKQETLDKEISKADNDNEALTLLSKKQVKLNTDFTVSAWLDSAAKKAGQISMATHAVKFTHSAAKGSNILAEQMGCHGRYLDTFCLAQPAIDAVGNAAALDVAKLLQLADENDKTLLEYIKQGLSEPLATLADNSSQLASWLEGFSAAMQDNAPSSHRLSKQVYFPVTEDPSGYHLLAPLYSSSLSQAVYREIQHSRFSQEMKAIRDARKANNPSEEELITYPNVAITMAGGTKPQNISQLNSARGGLTYLLDARAPEWQNQRPKLSQTALIFEQYPVRIATRQLIYYLALFIKANMDKTSTLAHRETLTQKVDEIAEAALNAVLVWQTLPAGWSDEYTQLSTFSARWLDPNNSKWHEDNSDWREPLSAEFGLWLKDSVIRAGRREFLLGAGEVNEWRQQFKQLLWEVK
ncbi:type I-F CRISPR-associated protein Csy1 [Photobacterium lutimaris]|uniref:Type I-F CRISPR-associated protein Csy1 n=1 Tax=Photobacterium lutimaris TaxID=388278 RepID=A0A2T3J4T4_9GAMM|nr:type I-F CRISPR-associated protein Csy1 [Photobacterium lutimaris]PSU36286.1 type I-F CRISPR-associated protein Csy1 [Photobacterium lutimaris]TDR74830.1 CRISPR-associated Csy1 family protein [Photobacterium lutimaris]